jgi:hypothetical protein
MHQIQSALNVSEILQLVEIMALLIAFDLRHALALLVIRY